MQENTALPTPDKEHDAEVRIVAGGHPPKKKVSRKRILLIVGIVIAVIALAVGGYFAYRYFYPPVQPNKDNATVVDVSSQIEEANQYEKGSYVWANIMLNAATYASGNGACSQANDIIKQVESTTMKEPVDTTAAKDQVRANCA
ncbi:MAG TPA: hypothetical protein VJ841_04685 [Candidatus Saccharimonadales bacterium]|nr:hypothetical protein [Candidatus Saccharimonadales bacterium]